MIIYLARNKLNGKAYVGQTAVPLELRIARHLRSNAGIFPSALRKYRDGFAFEIVAYCSTKRQADVLEALYISHFNTKAPNGYNLTVGGNGGIKGFKHSEKTRQKIAAARCGTGNGMFGKPSRRGEKHTASANKKNGEAHRELWRDPGYRERVSAAHRSSERNATTRAKQSEAKKRNWQNPEYRARMIAAHRRAA